MRIVMSSKSLVFIMHGRCGCLLRSRYVEDVVGVLAVSGVTTWKQFQCAKVDDLDWSAENATREGRKVFVRMALKKVKAKGTLNLLPA